MDDSTILTAAGCYGPGLAIDNLLAKRFFAHAERLEPEATRDEDGTRTLTYRTDARTLKDWKEAVANGEVDADTDPDDWTDGAAPGHIYEFDEEVVAPVVEMVWQVGADDAVVAAASATLILADGDMPDDIREMLDRLDIRGVGAMLDVEAILEGPILLVTGFEVADDHQDKGIGTALVARVLEDAERENGGTSPVILISGEDVGSVEDAETFIADLLPSDPRLAPGRCIILHEDVPVEDGDIDWGAAAAGASGRNAAEGAIMTAAMLRPWADHMRPAVVVSEPTVDTLIKAAMTTKSATREERDDARRALVAIAMFVANDARKGWRAAAERLLDAAAALDTRVTAGERHESKTSKPQFEAPGDDVAAAVFNRTLVTPVRATKGMRTGHVLDAMISEVAAEALAELAPIHARPFQGEGLEHGMVLIATGSLTAETLAAIAAQQG